MSQNERKTTPVAPAVSEFLDAAERAGYDQRPGRQNVSLLLNRSVVGGWNMVEEHWYITAASAIGHEAMLESLGFGTHSRRKGGRIWILPGAQNAPTFATAIRSVAGIPVA